MLLKIKEIILGFQMAKINVLHTYLRRRYIVITPCKRSAARGRRIPLTITNSVGVQPTTGLKRSGAFIYPEQAPLPPKGGVARGYPYLSPIRGRERVTIH